MTEIDNESLRDEAEALAAHLDRLNGPGGDPDEVAGGLERRDRELLGVLAGTVEPRVAPVGLRERILAQAVPSAAQEGEVSAAVVVPLAPVMEPIEDDDPGPAAADRRSRGSWLLPLAAVLALALFGLSGWQYFQLERQQVVIDRMAAKLDRALERTEGLSDLEFRLVESRAKLAMMTEPGAEYCLLKPVAEAEGFARARATMVVSASRDGWYLRAEGLEPCAEGRIYRVWWHTADGPIPAGTFDGAPGGLTVELSASEVPSEVRGVSITLEPDSTAAEPRGQRVLFADEAMRLL